MESGRNDSWQELVDAQKSQTAKNAPDENQIDSYYFIFNCFTNEIEYVNNAFETFTQYSKAKFTISKLLKLIHPDDMAYFLKCEERGLNFTNTLSFNQHFRYLMSYSYRIQMADGSYVRIKQQCQAIEVNSKGHLTKTFVMHQKMIEKFDPMHDYKVFDKMLNQYIDTENFYNLTKREQEILSLVQNGFSSSEIAMQLSVSKFTVDTHRKNILNKTNATNFMELTKKIRALS